MAKVSKKPRQQPQQEAEEQIGSIFDSIAQTSPDREEPAVEKKTEGPTVADLLTKIGGLEESLARQERAIAAAYTTPTVVASTVEQPKPVSMTDLPDPITDPNGYAVEIQRRITTNLDQQHRAREEQSRQERASNQTTEALWEDFRHAYPDHAQEGERVEFVAMKVANRMKARGVDMSRYMTGNRDGFMEDIAREYEHVFGKPEVDDADPAPQRQTRRGRSQVIEQDDDPGRTMGIFGGQESGGRPDYGSKPKPGDMIQDLQAMQLKSRLF